MAHEPAGSKGVPQPFTKTELLAALRSLEERLYHRDWVEQVKRLPLEDRQQFAASRLHLTAMVTRLNASLMRDIRERLEACTAELRTGIGELQGVLADLEKAAGWAEAVNRLLAVLGRVIPLL